jgi:hypothetical protein
MLIPIDFCAFLLVQKGAKKRRLFRMRFPFAPAHTVKMYRLPAEAMAGTGTFLRCTLIAIAHAKIP